VDRTVYAQGSSYGFALHLPYIHLSTTSASLSDVTTTYSWRHIYPWQKLSSSPLDTPLIFGNVRQWPWPISYHSNSFSDASLWIEVSARALTEFLFQFTSLRLSIYPPSSRWHVTYTGHRRRLAQLGLDWNATITCPASRSTTFVLAVFDLIYTAFFTVAGGFARCMMYSTMLSLYTECSFVFSIFYFLVIK
jgi:hypothetical protein